MRALDCPLTKFKSSPSFPAISGEPWLQWDAWKIQIGFSFPNVRMKPWSWRQSKSSGCSCTAYVKLCKIIQSTLSSILQDLYLTSFYRWWWYRWNVFTLNRKSYFCNQVDCDGFRLIVTPTWQRLGKSDRSVFIPNKSKLNVWSR